MSLKTTSRLASVFSLAIFLFAFIPQTFAQEVSADAHRFIVKVDGLNPADYATIVKSLRSEGQTSVAEACIPTGLICFQLPENWSVSQGFDQVKTVIETKTDLDNIQHLSEFSFDQFREACAQARLGRTGQQ